MKKLKKTLALAAVAFAIAFSASSMAHADINIDTDNDDRYFSSGHGPVGNVFYFVGDVIALPFRFIGNLFS